MRRPEAMVMPLTRVMGNWVLVTPLAVLKVPPM
jgi:hypothetical protein